MRRRAAADIVKKVISTLSPMMVDEKKGGFRVVVVLMWRTKINRVPDIGRNIIYVVHRPSRPKGLSNSQQKKCNFHRKGVTN